MSAVYRGTKPPGWPVEPEAWTYVRDRGGRKIAALVRPVPYDGTQHCLQNPMFTTEGRMDKEDVELMRKGCKTCPFLQACTYWSLAHEPFDFWAGMTADERVDMRKRARIKLVPRSEAERFGLVLLGLPA